MTREVQIVLEPSSAIQTYRPQRFLAYRTNRGGKTVFVIHELVDLALRVLLQSRQSVPNDFEEDIVEDLKLSIQGCLNDLVD